MTWWVVFLVSTSAPTIPLDGTTRYFNSKDQVSSYIYQTMGEIEDGKEQKIIQGHEAIAVADLSIKFKPKE